MAEARVADDEMLYRSIQKNDESFREVDGRVVFTSVAFNDRRKQPSVDRAILRNNQPELTKLSPTDGVVTLHTERVRAIGAIVQNDQRGNVLVAHKIDVVADPLPDNVSHALVRAEPEFANDKVFKKLKEALARLATEAGWTITPS